MVVPIGTLLRQEFVIVNDLVLVIGFVHDRLVKQGCGSSLFESLENCEVGTVKGSKNGVTWLMERKVLVFTL